MKNRKKIKKMSHFCKFYCLKQFSKFGVIKNDEANKFGTARNNTQHVAKLPAAKPVCV